MIWVYSSPSEMYLFKCFVIVGLIFIIEIHKKDLLLLKGRLYNIENKSKRDKCKNIDFVALAVFIKILEKIFFV